jgi:FtsH-binding integral membrane protein
MKEFAQQRDAKQRAAMEKVYHLLLCQLLFVVVCERLVFFFLMCVSIGRCNKRWSIIITIGW